MPMLVNPYILRRFAPWSREADAYFSAWATAPVDPLMSHLATWIAGLIADGCWADTGYLLFTATPDQQSACVPVNDPGGAPALPTASPVHTAGLGYVSNGAGWIDTQRSINGGIAGYTQNDGHLAAYAAFTTNIAVAVGNLGAGRVRIGRSAGTLNARMNAGTDAASGALAVTVGHSVVLSRDNSADYARYIDGGAATVTAQVSATFSTATNLAIFNINGAIASSGARVSAVSAGAAFDAAQAAAWHARTQTLMAAIGAS